MIERMGHHSPRKTSPRLRPMHTLKRILHRQRSNRLMCKRKRSPQSRHGLILALDLRQPLHIHVRLQPTHRAPIRVVRLRHMQHHLAKRTHALVLAPLPSHKDRRARRKVELLRRHRLRQRNHLPLERAQHRIERLSRFHHRPRSDSRSTLCQTHRTTTRQRQSHHHPLHHRHSPSQKSLRPKP